MAEICQNYARNMPKIFPKYVHDISNNSPKICPEYVQYVLMICPKYVQDTLVFQGGGFGWAGLGLGCAIKLPE